MAIPVLLLITAAIFDFGMLFRSWEVVTNAAREGARVGILPAYSADENVRLRVEQYMNVGGVAAACVLQTPSGGTCPPGECSVCVQTLSAPLASGSIATRVVTVTSAQQLPSLRVIAGWLGANSTVNVSASSEMRTETQAAGP